MRTGAEELGGVPEGQGRAQRESTADRLGQGDHVGGDAVGGVREPLPGAAGPGLHLVDGEQRADRVRLGLAGLYLRRQNDWHRYEEITAWEWLRKYVGRQGLEKVWGPLLRGKFADQADVMVNARLAADGIEVLDVVASAAFTAAAAFTMPAPQPEHVAGKARAVAFILLATSSGVRFGLADSISAATAATCGVAIDVPA